MHNFGDDRSPKETGSDFRRYKQNSFPPKKYMHKFDEVNRTSCRKQRLLCTAEPRVLVSEREGEREREGGEREREREGGDAGGFQS